MQIYTHMENVLFTTLGLVLVVIGLIGSVLPVLPGAPLSWVGLLLFKYSGYAQYSWWLIWILLVFVIIGIIMDYVVPSWGAKKMGGTKWGVRGTFVGLIIGIIFSPFGGVSIFVCPFLGAFVGEIIHDNQDIKRALKAAIGSFLGFLTTTGYSLILCLVMLVLVGYGFFTDILNPIVENVKFYFWN